MLFRGEAPGRRNMGGYEYFIIQETAAAQIISGKCGQKTGTGGYCAGGIDGVSPDLFL